MTTDNQAAQVDKSANLQSRQVDKTPEMHSQAVPTGQATAPAPEPKA